VVPSASPATADPADETFRRADSIVTPARRRRRYSLWNDRCFSAAARTERHSRVTSGPTRSDIPPDMSLLVVQGPDQGSRYELADVVIGLGRGTENVICLTDSEVSRNHARLIRDGETWTIRDLGSSNGTFVNGQGAESRKLKTGDHIQLGRTILLLTSLNGA